MISIVIGCLMLFAALIVLIASVGIFRFNNLLARMHAVTKVSSLGVLLLLIALNLFFLNWLVLLKTAVIFGVLVFLSPVSSHVIARAAQTSSEGELFEPEEQIEGRNRSDKK